MAQKRENTDQSRWQQAFSDGLEGFVKLELAAEDMVKNEASLVKAWLADDAQEAGHYLSGLVGELSVLEQRAGRWVLAAANPVDTDWLHLSLCLGHSAATLVAGEMPGGLTVSCAQCQHPGCLDEQRRLMACGQCGGELFVRQEMPH